MGLKKLSKIGNMLLETVTLTLRWVGVSLGGCVTDDVPNKNFSFNCSTSYNLYTANILPLQSKGFPCVLFLPCNLTVHSKGIPFYPVICMSMEKGIPCNWEKPLIVRGDHFFYNRFPLCRVKDFPVFSFYPLLPFKYLQWTHFRKSSPENFIGQSAFEKWLMWI